LLGSSLDSPLVRLVTPAGLNRVEESKQRAENCTRVTAIFDQETETTCLWNLSRLGGVKATPKLGAQPDLAGMARNA
jgi:hypothetical protein